MSIKKIFKIKLFSKTTATESIDFKKQYDFILCNFVLNIIPQKKVRDEVIKNVYKLLSPNGYAVFEVRKEKDILTAKYKKPYLDGYLMGKNRVKTFQKPYSLDELKELLTSFDFNIVHSKKHSGSLSVLVNKDTKKVA